MVSAFVLLLVIFIPPLLIHQQFELYELILTFRILLVPRFLPRRSILQYGLYSYEPLFHGMSLWFALEATMGDMWITDMGIPVVYCQLAIHHPSCPVCSSISGFWIVFASCQCKYPPVFTSFESYHSYSYSSFFNRLHFLDKTYRVENTAQVFYIMLSTTIGGTKVSLAVIQPHNAMLWIQGE
jgi:hypothetical protein